MIRDDLEHNPTLEGDQNLIDAEGVDNSDDAEWLDLARSTWQASTDWMEQSLRSQWERNLAHFKSKHSPGSKYLTPAFQHRSKLFRPKTRSVSRRSEAAAAAAFFSTADFATVSPGDEGSEEQRVSAAIIQELMAYRLAKTIPWFKVCMGSYQDARNYGVCCLKPHWKYSERDATVEIPIGIGEDGAPIMHRVSTREVVDNKPVIDVLPPDTVHFDPGCDWTDPVNSSPYIILDIPMYAGDLLRMTQDTDSAMQWREVSLSDIVVHGKKHIEDDTVERARGGNRQDPHDLNTADQFAVVWLREYWMRRTDGEDYIFCTLGDSIIVSDPVPLDTVYLHGIRPLVVGTTVIEAHQPYPCAPVEMGEDLQAAANDVQNQRMDNVRIVLNKQYFARRAAGIDTKALTRSTPGGVVEMDDTDKDVKVISTPDVTSSAYAEQDRLNMDFDELMGAFSPSSVAANRKLNETVGGMEMMNAGADAVTEYDLKTFAETAVEPVLQQLARLEQAYETDTVVIGIAAGKAKLLQRYGINRVTDQMLKQDVSVRVNVGMGNTDPRMRVQKIVHGMQAVAGLPTALARVKEDEVISEIFGALGYADGERFFKPVDEAQQQQPPPDPAIEKARMDTEMKMQQLQFQAWKTQQELGLKRELEMMKLALQERITLGTLHSNLGLKQAEQSLKAEDIKTKRDTTAINANLQMAEMDLRRATGAGI